MKKYIGLILLVFVILFGVSCSNDNKIKQTEDQKYYEKEYKYLDDKQSVFVKIDYEKLQELIDKNKTAVVYFGGSWCPNCQAVVKYINDIAKKMHISKVYNFDTKIDFDGEIRDIRRCNTEEDLQMWSNIVNRIDFDYGKYVTKDGNEIVDSNGKKLSSMPVPTLVVIKEGKVVTSVTKELFYNPDTETLWDTNTFDGTDMTDEYKTLLVSLFTIYDGCTDDECNA